MRHVLTRQQLNDMIWERAVSNVAPGLGISDVALRKQCVKQRQWDRQQRKCRRAQQPREPH